MERHPVPQHISGYEFRLIGDMTLKQFGELALGAILALICWYLPIAAFFKYPLVILFAFLGVALAFIPINEQSLDRWIINFLKSVYSPTQYIFKKSEVSLEFLARPVSAKPIEPSKIPPSDRKKLEEYLRTIPAAEVPPFEKEPEEDLEKIGPLFEEKITPPEVTKIPKIKRPAYKTIKPKFEPELPMPAKPTVPNILVGMVLDEKGKIFPDVIIEIRDKEGFPVRALKTNKLGQFRIATPLKNGVYEIELEKEGYQFDIIKFETKGEIIEPMEIRAKEGPAHAS